jgi:hypothetical protein
MAKTIHEKVLTLINFSIVLYFLGIYALYVFEVNNIAVGVVQELLTIPFLIAQLVFLFVGGKRFLAKEKLSSLYVMSFSLLALCAILTVGSFFVQ